MGWFGGKLVALSEVWGSFRADSLLQHLLADVAALWGFPEVLPHRHACPTSLGSGAFDNDRAAQMGEAASRPIYGEVIDQIF
jgi:hypothetical protein